jgi:nucleotide-binding universal stress UspA family protein
VGPLASQGLTGATELTIFKNILCVVDTREECTNAIERAVTLAENNQANLTVIDVVYRITAGIGMPDGGPISADLQSAVETTHAQKLELLIDPYRQRIPIATRVRNGTRFLEVIDQVLCNGHDLVIKVPEKLAWLDRLFGSDDMNLLRLCPCPVWLVKPQTEKSYKHILAAVDVSDEYPPEELTSQRALNRQIVEMAASLALSEFAELHLVHAWHVRSESAMRGAYMHTSEEEIVAYVEQEKLKREAGLDELLGEVTRQLGQEGTEYLCPKKHLVKGWASKEIPAMAKQLKADVIIMGTVARTGVPGFIMGNTAETILSQIECSVLAVKPPGFETPVR